MAYIGTKPANQVIDSTLIADGVISTSDLANGAVTDAKIASMAASKLTGILPDANAPSGSVIQVVSAITTSSFTSSGSQVTVLEASITPSSTSSRIVVMYATGMTDNIAGTRDLFIRIRRGGSSGAVFSVFDTSNTQYFWSTSRIQVSTSMQVLDSPATTSSTTYGVYLLGNTVNITGCSLVLMEIAG
jgi:hypothetical protein